MGRSFWLVLVGVVSEGVVYDAKNTRYEVDRYVGRDIWLSEPTSFGIPHPSYRCS